MPSLTVGSSGSDVRHLQQALKTAGFYSGTVDGKFGNGTKVAVEKFQESKHMTADGKAGAKTMAALDGFDGPAPVDNNTSTSGAPENGVAQIAKQKSGPGMVKGKITVNGHTYDFQSGRGNLFSTPQGEYRVIKHMNSRSEDSFSRDGVGFSFQLEDANRSRGNDSMYDRRAGRDRVNLRIHPDGGVAGTAGCIGILGDAATMKRFRSDLNAEIDRNGGEYRLTVR